MSDDELEGWLNDHVQLSRVPIGDVELHVASAGDGPPVLLLHGFPEFWYGFRNQIRPLVEAGYRVIAPDLRGFNLSDKPAEIGSYRMDVVAADIARLIDRLVPDESVSVVSHDWGTTVAWLYVMQHQARVRRFAALAGPEPWYMSRSLRWSQFRRHPYFFLFQWRVAERLLTQRDCRGIRAVFANDAQTPGVFSTTSLDRYAEAFARPGAARATLNYYRAIKLISPDEVRALQSRLSLPVLIVVAGHDRYIGIDGADPGDAFYDSVEVVTIDESSHWLLTDAAPRVNELLLDFLDQPI
ncbi:MAG: alpha/beta hydrolase [Actinomycetota bacterium]